MVIWVVLFAASFNVTASVVMPVPGEFVVTPFVSMVPVIVYVPPTL